MRCMIGVPAGAGSGALVTVSPSSREGLGEPAEELGLDGHRLLELVQQHALVRRVDVREPVGRPQEQDLRVRGRFLERADERDGATGRDERRLAAPDRVKGGACGLVRRLQPLDFRFVRIDVVMRARAEIPNRRLLP